MIDAIRIRRAQRRTTPSPGCGGFRSPISATPSSTTIGRSGKVRPRRSTARARPPSSACASSANCSLHGTGPVLLTRGRRAPDQGGRSPPTATPSSSVAASSGGGPDPRPDIRVLVATAGTADIARRRRGGDHARRPRVRRRPAVRHRRRRAASPARPRRSRHGGRRRDRRRRHGGRAGERDRWAHQPPGRRGADVGRLRRRVSTGVTALLAMHASCASGVTVVGIDNGFGAAGGGGEDAAPMTRARLVQLLRRRRRRHAAGGADRRRRRPG